MPRKGRNIFDEKPVPEVQEPTKEERRIVLERKHWQAGAGHFEFRNDEITVRVILKCDENLPEIEMSWPKPSDLPF